MPNYEVKTETNFWGNDQIVVKRKMTAYEAGSTAGAVIGSLLQARQQNIHNSFQETVQKIVDIVDSGHYEEAYQLTQNVLNKLTDEDYKGSLLILKSRCERFLGRYEEALISINHSIQKLKNSSYTDADQELGYANMEKGKILVRLNKSKEAIDFITESIRQINNPQKTAGGFHYRGIAFRELHNYEQAIKDLDNAISIYPNFGEYYLDRGLVFVKTKDYQKALNDFEQAAIFDAKSSAGYRNKGLIFAEMEKHNEAITEYNKAIQRDPNYLHNYLARAKSYRAIKWESKAKEDESIVKEIEAKAQAEQSRKILFDDYLSTANNLFINGIDKPLHTKFSKDSTFIVLGIASILFEILYILTPSFNTGIFIVMLLAGLFFIKGGFDTPKKQKQYNEKYLTKISEIDQQKQKFNEFYKIYLEERIGDLTEDNKELIKNKLKEKTKTLLESIKAS